MAVPRKPGSSRPHASSSPAAGGGQGRQGRQGNTGGFGRTPAEGRGNARGRDGFAPAEEGRGGRRGATTGGRSGEGYAGAPRGAGQGQGRGQEDRRPGGGFDRAGGYPASPAPRGEGGRQRRDEGGYEGRGQGPRGAGQGQGQDNRRPGGGYDRAGGQSDSAGPRGAGGRQRRDEGGYEGRGQGSSRGAGQGQGLGQDNRRPGGGYDRAGGQPESFGPRGAGGRQRRDEGVYEGRGQGYGNRTPAGQAPREGFGNPAGGEGRGRRRPAGEQEDRRYEGTARGHQRAEGGRDVGGAPQGRHEGAGGGRVRHEGGGLGSKGFAGVEQQRSRGERTSEPLPVERAKKLIQRRGSEKHQIYAQQLREKRIETQYVGELRIQKALALSGVGSRRDCDVWVAEGRVSINGVVATPGARAKPGDMIRFDGKSIDIKWPDRLPRIVIYHKQEGELVSRDDPEGRTTVFERLPKVQSSAWVAVGRLDFNTSGLLIFTTSGDLANHLMHPRFEVEREYAVRVLGSLTDEQKAQLKQGVALEDGEARFDVLEDQGGEGKNHWYRVILREGRNREVRRMFEHFDIQVSRLMRVRFGALTLPSRLKRGQYYELDEPEVLSVLKWAGLGMTGRVGTRR